ncbi:MAG: dual specificity protein phosphatase family protein, partial [Planctomycetota bacterium]|nr:dual specificity protein phosphatase family protein [Planctomycetota bacterium]
RIESSHLWIGHAGDGRNYRRLFDEGISVIVRLAIEEEPLTAPREFTVLRFPLHDGGNTPDVLRFAVEAVAHIVRSELPSLVCCSAGMSRSPAVTAAAISLVDGRNLSQCLEHVTRGGAADVSPSLWQELCDLKRH